MLKSIVIMHNDTLRVSPPDIVVRGLQAARLPADSPS